MENNLEEETECPCGNQSNHDGGEIEGCLEGGAIRLNI